MKSVERPLLAAYSPKREEGEVAGSRHVDYPERLYHIHEGRHFVGIAGALYD